MNHTSEWTRFYHPKKGRYFYKHKGTGVVTDSLFKIGKVLKKPLVNLAKQVGKKVAEKGAEKVSTVVVKKAGDKIENVLRKRGKTKPQLAKASAPTKYAAPTKSTTRHQALIKLNNLIAQL